MTRLSLLHPPAPAPRTLMFAALATFTTAATLNPGQALAQAALEEVIVTAERREASLQDVPISLVAFDSGSLEKMGIDDLLDISANIPNLTVNNFNGDPTGVRLFIRGIGQNDVQITQDPSVALYLDGVYVGTSFGTGFEGVDIERLEVLRGPQGTLYGRNATGGAVNIVTRRASTGALEFKQSVDTGNLDLFKSRTVLNVPLGETFAAKVSYLHAKRGGYVENHGVGGDYGEQLHRSGVVDLRFEPGDTVTLDYRFEDARLDDNSRLEQALRAGDPAELPPGTPDVAFLVTPGEVSPDRQDDITALWDNEKVEADVRAHTLVGQWDLNDHITLKSITGQRELESHLEGVRLLVDWRANLVPGGGPVNRSDTDTSFEQFSQELQFLGVWEHWDVTAGLYYYEDEADQDARSTSLGLPPPEFDYTSTENSSLAAYAQATWTPAFMDQRWHITLGGRYSRDSREAFRLNTRSAQFAASAPDGASYDRDFSNFNPSLTVAFDLSDSINLYGKVVSGYKSGGTSMRSANSIAFLDGFDEEDVMSYEAGFKGDFLDRRARLNAAVFYMDFDGFQASLQTGMTAGERDFLPIDGSVLKGMELEFTYLLNEQWQAGLRYGYLDSELGEQEISTPAGTFTLTEQMAFAPENGLSLSLDYLRDLGNGQLNGHLGYSYQDESISSINTVDSAPVTDRSLLDASIGWSGIHLGNLPGRFSVTLWGRNLTDDEYTLYNQYGWAFVGANEVAAFGDPRTYGLTLSYDY